MDAFLGTILAVGFSFPPRGWMTCAGQLLNINSNGALFALLGTQYGGDGVNTFGLPDLRGRMPVGQSLGVTGRITGANGASGGTTASTFIAPGTGTASVTLTVPNLPAHNHTATFTAGGGGSATTVEINVSSAYGTSAEPLANGYLAAGATEGTSTPLLYAATGPLTKLNAGTATVTGGGGGGGTVTVNNTGSGIPLQAPVTVNTTGTVATTPPFQTVQYIICISGIYPSRN